MARRADGVVDFGYLESFVQGDAAIACEVLDLFRQQAESWAETLRPEDPQWRNVVHTIKGAARGVGANALGDACEKAEFGQPEDLPAVRDALDAAVAEIAAYQAARA